jgi:hypothetical protein
VWWKAGEKQVEGRDRKGYQETGGREVIDLPFFALETVDSRQYTKASNYSMVMASSQQSAFSSQWLLVNSYGQQPAVSGQQSVVSSQESEVSR